MDIRPPAPHRFAARIATALVLVGLLGVAPSALARGHSAASGPKAGGSIVIRQTNPPDCLDSYKSALAQVSQIDANVHLGLVSLNQKQKPIPGIAQKWTVAKNGKSITFFLRHDVKFSDGTPVTSADVKASFNHALDPATKSPVSKGFLAQVTKVSTPDKYTVKLSLSSPSRILLNELSTNFLGILEKKQLQKVGQNTCNGNLVGTGPYRITNVASDFSSVTIKPNKYYFNFNEPWANNKGKPYLSQVTYTSVVQDATAISELLTGQVDITGVPGSQLDRVQGQSGVALHKVLAQSLFLIIFNTAHPPFNSAAVRKGVAEAIDRSAIVKASFNGLAKPAYSVLPSTIPYSDPKAKTYAPKLDPAAAQKAISAAGAKGPYTLLTFNVPTTTSMGEIVQNALGQAGMQVNVVPKSVGDWVQAMGKGDFDISIFDYQYNDPDILYLLFNSSQGGGKGLAFTNYNNPTIDLLTQEGRQALNPKTAKSIYYKIQKQLVSNAVAVPLAVPIGVTATRSRVKGWHTDIAGNVLLQDLYVK